MTQRNSNMEKVIILLATACVAMADVYDFMPPSYTRTPLGNHIDISTMKILKAAYEVSLDKNIVSSPLGLMMLLSLYNEGMSTTAQPEISSFLGDLHFKQISDSYKKLSVKFSEMDPEHLTVADKIAVSDAYSLDEQFAAEARGYRCDFDSLDFTKPELAAATINKWAAEKTQDHITNPVSKDALSADTAVALFNVMFFKGHWHVPFKASETKKKDFHVSRDVVVKKPMMHLLQSLYYAESDELGAKMVELPYKEQGFRMVVVLPNEVDGLSSVLAKAAERGLLSEVFKLRPAGCDVDLDMPKFDIKSKLDLNDILPKVGVKKIFDEGAPGIVKNVPVRVSKAFQEAFIQVDEEGATAGAFTGLIAIPMMSMSRPPPPMKFTVDRPFLYVILHEDKILFVGTYSQ